MSINLIDVAIVAIILFSLFAGMHKGFIASGLSAVGFAAAWFGAMYMFPFLADALLRNESLKDFLSKYLDAGSFFKAVGAADTPVTAVLKDGSITQIISDMTLPDIIKNAFQQNVISQQFLSSDGITKLSEYLDATIIRSLINVTSFLVVFAVSYIFVLLFINLLNAVFHFPVLRHFDSLLGGVFGFARGAIVVMLILASIPIFEAVVQLDFFEKTVQQASLAPYFMREVAIPNIIQRAFDAVS